MLLFKMAVRNVFRNRRRSIITLSAIASGIFTLVLIKGLMDGIGAQSERNLIDMQYGHLQVYNQGYAEDPGAGLSDAIADPRKVMDELKSISHVKAEVERLQVPAMVTFNGNDMRCLLMGIDPTRDEDVFRIKGQVMDGRGAYLTEGPHAMIGERLARTLGADKGDMILWRARSMGKDGAGPVQADYVDITGILSTGNPAIDGAVMFVPLDYLRESLRAGDRASAIVVRLDNADTLAAVTRAVKAMLAPLGFEVKTWEDLGNAFIELHRMKKIGQSVMIGVFLFIVMVGMVNTMLMATFERVREIGMLMALGLTGRQIRRVFITEGAILGLIGSALGAMIATPLMIYLEIHGIPLAWFSAGKDVDIGYPITGSMYGHLSAELVIVALLVGVVMAVAATVLPAWRASRLDPTEALRHV